MEKISVLERKLNEQFHLDEYDQDPAFSRFIPMVYDPIGFDWRSRFEPHFVRSFNGLMLKGAEVVKNVFLAVFPTDHVLKRFIEESEEGDLLFMHHPLLMECGDPRGKWGRGFIPIKEKWLEQLKKKKLSIYTCHIPMDLNRKIGTNAAIAESLKARAVDFFFEGYGWVCEIAETNTEELVEQLLKIFEIPYVDFEGKQITKIQRIAIVAGCGDVVHAMREAEGKGAQAYITGEIHCHIDNAYGREKFAQIMKYTKETSMSLIGVSHSASEYLVMKTQMKKYIETHFDVQCILLPQEKWWL